MSRSQPVRQFRCGIYTRKSTEEGLDQDFNTLEAQRESGEAYVKSQASEGWTCVPTRYDDGGFTGANMDRPALKRLLADIEAGKIDVVVVYKVDRLSRSLLDFAKLLEVFDKHRVAFVSVTQQFNTSTSMGRLMLNVLLSFAQFERELISERTRDKMSAARRKGKWLGGRSIFGYDVDRTAKKLVVNETEATQVRAIFQLYTEHEALLPVVQELARRGWRNKSWTTKSGKIRPGLAFTKTSVHALLTNVTYIGKVKYKSDVYEGEHQGIVDPQTWQCVQLALQRNGRTGGAAVRNQFGAVLKGLLYCKPCGCAMSPTHSTKGTKRYRYYLCNHASKTGWNACPSKSIPAAEIERFVVGKIREIVQTSTVVNATISQVDQQRKSQVEKVESERRAVFRDLAHWHGDLNELVQSGDAASHVTARLADLQERIAGAQRRLIELDDEIAGLERTAVEANAIRMALAKFEPAWESLTPREQARLVGLVVERVDYDGGVGTIAIRFRAEVMPLLADDEEAAA